MWNALFITESIVHIEIHAYLNRYVPIHTYMLAYKSSTQMTTFQSNIIFTHQLLVLRMG